MDIPDTKVQTLETVDKMDIPDTKVQTLDTVDKMDIPDTKVQTLETVEKHICTNQETIYQINANSTRLKNNKQHIIL